MRAVVFISFLLAETLEFSQDSQKDLGLQKLMNPALDLWFMGQWNFVCLL